MKRNFIFKTKSLVLTLILLSGAGASAQYNLEWAKEYVSLNNAWHNIGGTAYDANNNYYVWGLFSDSIRVDFNSTSGYDLGTTDYSFFIAKYNTSGSLIWAKSIIANSNIWTYNGPIDVDAQGNVYMLGSCYFLDPQAQIDMDPGNGVTLLPQTTANGGWYNFVLKLDANGDFQWVKEHLTGGSNTRVMDVDNLGNVYVASEYVGTLDLGAPNNVTLNNPGRNLYVAKYNPSGQLVWAKDFAGSTPSSDTRRVSSLVVKNDNLFVSGWYRGNVDLNPGSDVDTLSAIAEEMSFIAQLDTAGTYVFAKRLIGNGNYIQDLAVDAAGNIYAVGDFYGTVDFDPNAGAMNLVAVGAANEHDAFVMKLNNTGTLSWAKRVGADEFDRAFACTIDNNGKLLVTGFFSGTVDFDPGNGTDEQEVNAEYDCFLLRLDADGNYETSHVWGGDMFDYAYGIFQDNDNNILIHGANGSTDMDYSGIERGGPSGVGYIMKISAETFVSIEYLANHSTMVVFPNPASNQFHIKELTLGTSITITDISGRVVYSGLANGDLMTISTQNWSNGMYLIQTELNGAVQQQKLMVQK
jgi:hypothetical protein